MKFHVEAWAPSYGVSSSDMEGESSEPRVDIEMSAAVWAPVQPSSRAAQSVLFVDGVRRIDANVWIEQDGDLPSLGICATYAAGAVRCEEAAELVEARVERGLFTSAPSASPIVTRHAAYPVRASSGTTPEELWLAMQQRMGALEAEVAASQSDVDLVVTDGPLGPGDQSAIGYVKTHRVHYLPPVLRPVIGLLDAGYRTPVFLTTTSWSRYMCYLRLPGPAEHPMASIVRLEIGADRSPSDAVDLADLVCASLPRFASDSHKDPRAPQNLYPIGGLERALRRRLGDPELLYRDLRLAAR